jgi:hypothetical protein
MHNQYAHTQSATLICILVGFWATGFFAMSLWAQGLGVEMGEVIILGTVALVCVVVVVLFHSLTVTINVDAVLLSFGIGLIHKSLLLQDVVSASAVRSRWYHGWGVRRISGGWLYNVSGFDAIELRMTSGRLVRIGTDEPDKLLAAVRLAMGKGQPGSLPGMRP